MRNSTFVLLCAAALSVQNVCSQGVKISPTPSDPHSSAILELESSGHGFLPPRLSEEERDAIDNPAEGLILFNTDTRCIEIFSGGIWQKMSCACSTAPASPVASGAFRSGATVFWSWLPVNGAEGYRGGSSPDIALSQDFGKSTSYSQVSAPGGTIQFYVWAYNACGSSTPLAHSLNPPSCPTTVTDVDGNVYNTRFYSSIGQCWMKENLKTGKYRTGAVIPQVTLAADWTTTNTGAWVFYNNNASNEATYGRLYNWHVISHPDGICPSGWHIPTNQEFYQLAAALGGVDAAGGKMKTTSGWNAPNTGASNLSQFTAVPSGLRSYSTGNFNHLNSGGFWWTSDEFQTGELGGVFYVESISASLIASYAFKLDGLSIRCLKD